KSVHIEKGEGRIEGGDIEAGLEIITNSIGNSKKKPTSVKLTNFRQSDLYGFLLKFEKEHGELSRQIAGLEKIIEVIRIIGAKVTSLPLEKKQELAAKVRQYNDFLLKRIKLEDEKKALLEADKSSDDLDRVIIAKQSIFGGVTVTIDRSVSLIQESYEKVILYKKGIIIIGNFDEFMNRKKYA
ncbi:MAG: FapA family protein, partial [Brevinematales bacterium]